MMKLIEKIGMGVVLMVASASASAAVVSGPVNSIPEPSTWALLAVGAMGVFFANRKK